MFAHFHKLRLLSLLSLMLLVSWIMPLLQSSTILIVSKAPAVHGDSIMTGAQTVRAAKQVAASAPCRKCPNGKADGSLLCNGPMLAIEVAVIYAYSTGLERFLMPPDRTAERSDVVPDPPPPRIG